MRRRSPTRDFEWSDVLLPLFKQYRGKKHPLEYKNPYQLLVMVVLAAQTTDELINRVAPPLFEVYPTLKHLARAKPEELFKYVEEVRNFARKARWLVTAAKEIGDDSKIPGTLEELTALPGIGRKSANVIMHETGRPAEGVIVDLHVLRVAPRIGVASGTNPEKIEKQLMQVIPQKNWGEAGMAFSFLGRELCRPTNPHCSACVMNNVCAYYKAMKK
ncbi:MAG: endonuclease III [Bacteroidota bacterium]